MDKVAFKVGDYVRYSSPFLRDIAGVGQIQSLQHEGETAQIKWSNQDIGTCDGIHKELVKYLELVSEEDIPLAILGTL